MLRGELPPDLTPGEVRVLRLRAKGLTASQTCRELGISHHTARNHAANAYQRLGVAGEGQAHPNNATLLRALNKLGWVQVPE